MDRQAAARRSQIARRRSGGNLRHRSRADHGRGRAARSWTRRAGCTACAPDATDLEAALDKVAANPDARDGPVVLVTDGWENHGDAERALGAIRSADVRLYIFTPPGARGIPNVAITEPQRCRRRWPSRSRSRSASPPPISTTPVERNDFDVRKRARDRRAHRHAAKRPAALRLSGPCRSVRADFVHAPLFKPANPAQDVYTEDDSLTGWVGIGAQRKVLILTGSARDAKYLESVVHRLGLDPTVVTPSGSWSGNLKGYDAVVLDNVPRSRLSPAAQNALVQLRRRGRLARDGRRRRELRPGRLPGQPARARAAGHHEAAAASPAQRALVLIIDKSGSMGRDDKARVRQGGGAHGHQDAHRQRSDRGHRLRLATVRGRAADSR